MTAEQKIQRTTENPKGAGNLTRKRRRNRERVKEEILEAEGRRINNTIVKVVQKMKKKNGSIDQARFWEVHIKSSTEGIENQRQ